VRDILVLGGTAWLGGEVARAALARDARVTCLARGVSGTVPDGATWVTADRDRADAYEAVRDQDWDDVVDVSWQPGQVRSALAALSGRARHWTYVSSGSVYAGHATPDADERAELLPALEGDSADAEHYGEAKVACEQACRDAVGDRLLVARSGLIGGYGDPSDRFGYWPARFAAAAEASGDWATSPAVLVPAEEQAPTQTLDVHDLAEWLARAGESGVVGTFNAVGERVPLGTVLREAARAAGFAGPVVRVPSSFLRDQRVEEYMGPRSLPLWIADVEWSGFSSRDGSAARAAGLTTRPLLELVADALRWERELGLGRERKAGLTPQQERELLAAWSG
jgi:nucleoside-diphosphate-sugar epimerase